MRSQYPRALLALLLLVTVSAATPASRLTPGYTFTIRMALRAPTTNGNRMLIVKGQAIPGHTRLDLSGSAGTGNEIGDDEYILISDSSVVAVNEVLHRYNEKSIETGTLVTMMRSRISGSSVTGFSATLDSLGSGEVVDGRPTRKYKATFDYTTSGRAGPTKTHSTYEYWMADLPFPLDNPFDGRLRPSRDSRQMMAAELPVLLDAWKRMGSGTVVKVLANTTIGTAPYVRTLEISNVKPAEIDPSIFAIPAGYTHGQ